MFTSGYHYNIENLKALKSLNSPLGKLNNIDSLLYVYEYKSCKIDNDVLKWNIYLETYPHSPWFHLAEKQRDSLEFKQIVYYSKNLSSSKYLSTLEEFVKSHPNSVYTANADEIIKKIKSESIDKKTEEQSFLKRYAIFNDKILRFFVNENVLYSEYNKIRPDKRFLQGSNIQQEGYTLEIGALESFWSETNDYHLKNFRRDTITSLKTRILEDYGINLEDFPFRNTNKFELDNILEFIYEIKADPTVVLKNYVTTSISKVDEHGICYLAGFFINSKRYQKDIDCFIAKVNCNETNLGKKVIWLNEYSELTVEALNMNDWAVEIKAEGNNIYVESLNDKKEYTIYKFAASGEQLWKKKVSEIDPKLANINILSNGDLIIFGHSDYAYDDMCFTILSSQNGAVVKTTKKIANDPDGYFGTLVTTNNEFVVAINYLKYGEGADKQTSFGRALEINNSVGVNLPNIMLLKYNGSSFFWMMDD
jgi:hypothetical protein